MFEDRVQAGEQLSERVKPMVEKENTIVVGIPRGGVVVAAVIAQSLHLPLDVVIVKKIPSLHNPEFAIGAVGEDKIIYWEERAVKRFEIDAAMKQHLADEVYDLVAKREAQISMRFHRMKLRGKNVLLVDDGIATGATVKCAVQVLQKHGAKHITIVTPVTAEEVAHEIQQEGVEVIALHIASEFSSVGEFYQYFQQVSDEEVLELLSASTK